MKLWMPVVLLLAFLVGIFLLIMYAQAQPDRRTSYERRYGYYLYDARTELCFYRSSSAGTMVLVSCSEKVKALAEIIR